MGEKFSCWSKCKKEKIDVNIKLLELSKESIDKTTGFIRHILNHEILPSNLFCEKCEMFFIKHFNEINSIFKSPVLPFYAMQEISMKLRNTNRIPNQFKKSLKSGVFFLFDVKEDQLNNFEQSIKTIEDLQIELEEYYA